MVMVGLEVEDEGAKGMEGLEVVVVGLVEAQCTLMPI